MDDAGRQRVEGGRGDRGVRHEAIVHSTEKRAAVDAVADLDVDRIPDPEGEVRVIVTPEELERLKERGFEVRVVQDLPVKPLDPSLVEDDDSVRAWLEERVAGIERREET